MDADEEIYEVAGREVGIDLDRIGKVTDRVVKERMLGHMGQFVQRSPTRVGARNRLKD